MEDQDELYIKSKYCTLCGKELAEAKVAGIAGYNAETGYPYYYWNKRCPNYTGEVYGRNHTSLSQKRHDSEDLPF
jgi:hypothetical protein